MLDFSQSSLGSCPKKWDGFAISCVQMADTGWCGSAGAGGAFGVQAALHFILRSRVARELPPAPCPMPQPAAAPLPLTCAGVLGTRRWVESSFRTCSLSQVHRFGYSRSATGEAGAVQLPSAPPKIAVAFCSGQMPLAGRWPAAYCTGVRERGATWAKTGGPHAGFPFRGQQERGAGVQRVRAGSGRADPQTCGSTTFLPQEGRGAS